MENKLIVLNQSQQFEDCRRHGKKLFIEKKLLISYRVNKINHHRFGWTVPKYIGCAVLRNRLKRYCREFFRRNNVKSKSYFDLNVVFLKSSKDEFKKMDYKTFAKILLPAWESILEKH